MSGDGRPRLLALGSASATALHWSIYRQSRNIDNPHALERVTAVDAKPATGSERKVKTLTELRTRQIDGDYMKANRQRVTRFK